MVLSRDKMFVLDDPMDSLLDVPEPVALLKAQADLEAAMDLPEPVTLMKNTAQEVKKVIPPLVLRPAAWDLSKPVVLEEDALALDDDWFMKEVEEVVEPAPVPTPRKPGLWARAKAAASAAVGSFFQPRKWALTGGLLAATSMIGVSTAAPEKAAGGGHEVSKASSEAKPPQPDKIDWHKPEETKEYSKKLEAHFDENPVDPLPALDESDRVSFVVGPEHAGMGITQAFASESSHYRSLVQDPDNAGLSFVEIMNTLGVYGLDGNDLRKGDRLTMEHMDGKSWALLTRGREVYPFSLFPNEAEEAKVAAVAMPDVVPSEHPSVTVEPAEPPMEVASATVGKFGPSDTINRAIMPSDFDFAALTEYGQQGPFLSGVSELAKMTDPNFDVCNVRDMTWEIKAKMSLKDLLSSKRTALESMKEKLEEYQYRYWRDIWSLEGTMMEGTVYVYKVGLRKADDADGVISIKWHARLDADSQENRTIAEILAYDAVRMQAIPQLILHKRVTCIEPN